MPSVNYKTEPSDQGPTGGRWLKSWPIALGVIYAWTMQIFAQLDWRAGEEVAERRGLSDERTNHRSIDRWSKRSIDASEPSINCKVEESNRT